MKERRRAVVTEPRLANSCQAASPCFPLKVLRFFWIYSLPLSFSLALPEGPQGRRQRRLTQSLFGGTECSVTSCWSTITFLPQRERDREWLSFGFIRVPPFPQRRKKERQNERKNDRKNKQKDREEKRKFPSSFLHPPFLLSQHLSLADKHTLHISSCTHAHERVRTHARAH